MSEVRGSKPTALIFDEYGKELGEVTNLSFSIELPPVEVHVPKVQQRMMPLTFTTTIEIPKVRWWTKLWCWAWHGHWPKRQDVFDFAMDYYRCPCGEVAMPAEELIELSERYGRRLPRGC